MSFPSASPEIDHPAETLVAGRDFISPNMRARQISAPLGETIPVTSYRSRSRKKLITFLLLEGLTVLLLVGVAMLALSEHYAEESLTALFRNTTIALAVVAAVLPVLFYGRPRERYRSSRRYR